MKAFDTTITILALAVLSPAAAFAPSTASKAAIRPSRGAIERKMRTYAARRSLKSPLQYLDSPDQHPLDQVLLNWNRGHWSHGWFAPRCTVCVLAFACTLRGTPLPLHNSPNSGSTPRKWVTVDNRRQGYDALLSVVKRAGLCFPAMASGAGERRQKTTKDVCMYSEFRDVSGIMTHILSTGLFARSCCTTLPRVVS